jgi:hypothetical protein
MVRVWMPTNQHGYTKPWSTVKIEKRSSSACDEKKKA